VAERFKRSKGTAFNAGLLRANVGGNADHAPYTTGDWLMAPA